MGVPELIRAYVEAISPVTDVSWRAIEERFARRTFDARDYICPPLTVAREVGILAEGWVRAYMTDEAGHEFTKHLFRAPDAVGDYASLLTGQRVRVPQQALTDCIVYFVPWDHLQSLAESESDIALLLRRYAEAAYLQKEQREIELATMDAAARYEQALQRFPGIEQALPQYEIAAYLAITPTQLSRVRARRVGRS